MIALPRTATNTHETLRRGHKRNQSQHRARHDAEGGARKRKGTAGDAPASPRSRAATPTELAGRAHTHEHPQKHISGGHCATGGAETLGEMPTMRRCRRLGHAPTVSQRWGNWGPTAPKGGPPWRALRASPCKAARYLLIMPISGGGGRALRDTNVS